MSADAFFDTNIFLYAGSRALKDARKQKIAERLLKTVPFATSAQVLQEYIVNAVSKKSLGLDEDNVNAMLKLMDLVAVLPISNDLIGQAVRVRRRHAISHWDATIVAAAQELGCTKLYTEDLNSGQDYGGVEVLNPFAA